MSETLCEKCGRQIGTGHDRLEVDCVIEHLDHHERFVGMVCKRHYHWIDRTLVEILELFALLDDVVVPGPSSEERHGSSIHSPAPGRLDVMALTDRRGIFYVDDPEAIPDVPGGLATWVRIVIEERELTDVPDGTITSSVRLLRRERHWIAAQAWVDEYASDLAFFHRKVAHGAGDSMWPKSIGPCPNCRKPLFNTVGVDRVDCGRCKSSWEGIALTRLRLILEQEAS